MPIRATINPYTVRPIELQPGDVGGYKVVFVIGYENDWAAYRGLTHWSDSMVAEQGDKIPREAAEALFPAAANSGRHYRD